MKKEKPLSEEIEYKNEISPDFIGDNPADMREGTITPIGYIKAEKVKQKFKEILNEIDGKKWNYSDIGVTDNEKVWKDLEKIAKLIKQKAGELAE